MPQEWRPILLSELATLLECELVNCVDDDLVVWSDCKCEPFTLEFKRFGDSAATEPVFVVAVLKGAVIFYDDVEEGFAIGKPQDTVLSADSYFFQELRYCLRNFQQISIAVD